MRRAAVEPAPGRRLEGAAGLQPVEVVGAQLHDVGHLHQPLDPREIAVAVADERGPHVDVDGDHAITLLALHERLQRRAARLLRQAERTEVERAHRLLEGGQVGIGQHPTGRAFVEEGVARLAAGESDEGERRGTVARLRVGEIDAARRERVAEDVAEEVGGEAAEETRRHAEAADSDGDVHRRAAGERCVGDLAGDVAPRDEIDQGFAAGDDHVLADAGPSGTVGRSGPRMFISTPPAFNAFDLPPLSLTGGIFLETFTIATDCF